MKQVAVLAGALALALLPLSALAQSDVGVVDTSTCDAAKELPGYYGLFEAVIYSYSGVDGAKLLARIESPDYYGPMPRHPGADAPAVVWLGYNIDTGRADLFFYDAKGCFVNYLGLLPKADVITLFEDAGVAVPLGATFYQMPNAPGAPPGSNI